MEIWRNINDFYAVSNIGNVKSVERTVIRKNGRPCTVKEKILSPQKNTSEHLQVWLYNNGVKEPHYVHVLVATAFIPNPNNYDVVHHINHDKSDNRVENLEWMDGNEHAIMHGIEGNVNRKKTVYQYTIDGELVKIWSSTLEIEKELGYNNGAISACCRGEKGYKTHKGFKWSYSNDRC